MLIIGNREKTKIILLGQVRTLDLQGWERDAKFQVKLKPTFVKVFS